MHDLIKALNLPGKAAWRQAVRMTVAALLAYFATGLVGFQHGYWAVITCLVIIQGSVGATISAGLARVAGTAAGAILGAVGALVPAVFHGFPEWLILLLVIAPLALLAASKAIFRLAPLTGALVLLVAGSSDLGFALSRIAEIALGTLIGVLAALFILPERATAILVERSAAILEQLGAFTVILLSKDDPLAHERVALKLRAGFAQLQNDLKEVAQERNAHLLHSNPFPERLARHLQRLRTDVNMLGRAAAPVPDSHTHEELAKRIRPLFDGYAGAIRIHTEPPNEQLLDELRPTDASESPLGFALLTLQAEFKALHETLQQRPA